jgi:prepilin-type N-terminal cleavage/methylation domain-containing protein
MKTGPVGSFCKLLASAPACCGEAGHPTVQSRGRDPAAGSSGFTLVEVVVATMVVAMMVTAFMSVALSSRMQTGRVDHKIAANQQAKRVLERLRNYVVDPNRYSSLPGGAGVLPCDVPAGVWALNKGLHDVTSWITGVGCPSATPDPALSPLPNISMVYCVADAGENRTCTLPNPVPSIAVNCTASPVKCVQVQVYWNEQGI